MNYDRTSADMLGLYDGSIHYIYAMSAKMKI